MILAEKIYTSYGKIIVGLSNSTVTAAKIGVHSRCCECDACFNTIFVICIYDEAQDNYYPFWEPYTTYRNYYLEDRNRWDAYVDNYRCNSDIRIRMGLLVPYISPDAIYDKEWLRLPGYDWPYDTETNPIVIREADGVDNGTGYIWIRVSSEDIIAIFNEMKGQGLPPELLIFTLDNSGSIYVSNYQAELDEAKEQLQNLYPDMRILDDISSAQERWIRDAMIGVSNRLCKYRCLCPPCLNARPEQIAISIPYGLPGLFSGTSFRGTFFVTPDGLSSDTECKWQNTNMAVRKTVEGEYVYDYSFINATLTLIFHNVHTGEYYYRYRVVVTLISGSSILEYTWETTKIFYSDSIDCQEVVILPLVSPATSGLDLIWNPS